MYLGRTYSEPWQNQETWLAGMLANATNAGGSLAFLAAPVEGVAPPASIVNPVLGFQFRSARDEPIGQNRLRQIALFEFHLILARDYNPLQTDAAKQIKVSAEKAWNGQDGTGLGAALRLDPTLGGLATYSYIQHQVVVGRGVLDENLSSALIVATMTTYAEDFSIY